VTVVEWLFIVAGILFLSGTLWAVWDWWRTVRRLEGKTEEAEGETPAGHE
jgi:hypothetical protein